MKRSKAGKSWPSHKLENALICDFLGLPGNSTSNSSRDPIHMEKLVEKVWENWGIGEAETPEKTISESWQQIVGPKLAGKCAPVRLSNDGSTLEIRAVSGTIKQELSFCRSALLKKIQKLKNCNLISKIRIS